MEVKRDPGIEFLRVALMFGICILHAVQHGGHFNQWVAGPLCATVNCFVFVSGYYGICFDWGDSFCWLLGFGHATTAYLPGGSVIGRSVLQED